MAKPVKEKPLERTMPLMGVRVDNPAWKKYMRSGIDIWEGPANELEEHQVSTERVCPVDGGGSPVRGQD